METNKKPVKPSDIVVYVILIGLFIVLIYSFVDKLGTDGYYITKRGHYTVRGPHQLSFAERIFPEGVVLVAIIGIVIWIVYEKFKKERNTAEYWFESASKSFEQGDFHGAIVDHTKAINIEPDNADAYWGRGLAKDCLKDYYGAIDDYSKTIDFHPDDGVTYIARGTAYLALDRNTEARKDFMSAVELGYTVPQELFNKCD